MLILGTAANLHEICLRRRCADVLVELVQVLLARAQLSQHGPDVLLAARGENYLLHSFSTHAGGTADWRGQEFVLVFSCVFFCVAGST